MTAEESEQYDAGSSDDERDGESGQQQQQQAASDSDAEGDSSEEDAGTEDQPSFSGVEDPLRCRRKSRRGGRTRNTVRETYSTCTAYITSIYSYEYIDLMISCVVRS